MKILLAGLLLAAGTASANPTFNFQYVPGTPLEAQQGFQAAAARWSSLLHDNVTVNLMVGFSHALGFIGRVDILDGNSPPYNGPFNNNQFIYVSTLDLFRYSALSSAQGVINWTADSRAKYFSLDGTTLGPQFSTGVNFGDGHQASHRKDNLFIGLMAPTAGLGETLHITNNDVLAMDVIGWNVAAIPEPSGWTMLGAGVLLIGIRQRGRSNKLS